MIFYYKAYTAIKCENFIIANSNSNKNYTLYDFWHDNYENQSFVPKKSENYPKHCFKNVYKLPKIVRYGSTKIFVKIVFFKKP